MEVPTLATLLDDYVRRWHMPHSPISPVDLDRLEEELDITLPPDYRDLACRYDLRKVEVYFSSFAPPAPQAADDLTRAIWLAMRSDVNPFTTFYNERGVIPVGSDWNQADFVMMVRAPAGMTSGAAQDGRPLGTILAFDWESVAPELAYVSMSFGQALHIALYLNSVRSLLKGHHLTEPEALATITAIDRTIDGYDYWTRWIANMAAG